VGIEDDDGRRAADAAAGSERGVLGQDPDKVLLEGLDPLVIKAADTQLSRAASASGPFVAKCDNDRNVLLEGEPECFVEIGFEIDLPILHGESAEKESAGDDRGLCRHGHGPRNATSPLIRFRGKVVWKNPEFGRQGAGEAN
jgi:hypothetical protein